MGLTRKTDSKRILLQAKHFCLWQESKTKFEGCDEVEVTNPKTHQQLVKYGTAYDEVSGHVTKLEKYDTGKKYATRFFGFKMHMQDGGDTFIIDMPYHSQLLRRFLRIMPNIDFNKALSLKVFKGRSERTNEAEQAIWFRQGGESVKSYFTKEQPHGMPPATQDRMGNWDFRTQHQWLVAMLIDHIMPRVDEAAKRFAPPVKPEASGDLDIPDTEQLHADEPPPFDAPITDDDVPF